MRTRTRRIARGALVVALVAVAAQQAWRHGHDYVFAERFVAIEPDAIYRGAWLKSWPMERVVRRHGIKTVVALAHHPDNPMVAQERKLGEELGFRFLHVPIVDERTDPDKTALYDRLEDAAAEVADPANQPVLFHCHHGVNRASMVQMAYRMLYCGYSLDEAEDEVARLFGLRKVDKGPDYRAMRGFYQDRVLPRRLAESRPRAGAAGATPR